MYSTTSIRLLHSTFLYILKYSHYYDFPVFQLEGLRSSPIDSNIIYFARVSLSILTESQPSLGALLGC